MRRSRKDCQQVLNVIRNKTGQAFELHWESNGARVCLPHGPGWKEISERMPPTAMYSWLEAMEIGLEYGNRTHLREIEKRIAAAYQIFAKEMESILRVAGN